MSRVCRRTYCDNTATGDGGHAGRFCSPQCEVKHDHIRADAMDARRGEGL